MTNDEIKDKLCAFVKEHNLIMEAISEGTLIVEEDGDNLTGAGIVVLAVHSGAVFYRPAGWSDFVDAFGSADAVRSIGLDQGKGDRAVRVGGGDGGGR